METQTNASVTIPLRFHIDDLTETTIPGKLITVFTVADALMVFVILISLAVVYDIKINRERHPVFLPFRPPKGFRLYAVLIETGQSPAGGTSSKVFLRIIGKFTKTPGFTLICTSKQRRYGGRKLFGSQNKDIFILAVPHYLGRIEAFEVMTDRRGDSPPWFLKSIRAVCLDNKKCWKSEVSAWLRGDGKPYLMKASLIGALSTRSYIIKVFLQQHLWISAWFRSLGSSYSCLHRALVQWTSVTISITAAHLQLYENGLLENIRRKQLVVPEYSFNNIAQAAFIASVAGVIAATLLRVVVKLLAGNNTTDRVDDKEDLCHLMGRGKLKYVEGAVIRLSGVRFEEAKEAKQLTTEHGNYQQQNILTSQQRRAIQHILECQVSNCRLRKILNDPNYNFTKCKMNSECYFNIGPIDKVQKAISEEVFFARKASPVHSAIPTSYRVIPEESKTSLKSIKVPQKPKFSNNLNTSTETQSEESLESEESDFNESVSQKSSVLSVSNKKSGRKLKTSAVNLRQNTKKIQRKPTKRQEAREKGKGFLCRLYEFVFGEPCEIWSSSSDYDLPQPSALARNNLTSPVSTEDKRKFQMHMSAGPELVKYDSLSEPESDEELITKSTRTESEINLVRRSGSLYASAPQWHDRYHVWMEANKDGLEHHEYMKRRYDLTSAGTLTLSTQVNFLPATEKTIFHYLIYEHNATPGKVIFPSTVAATTVTILGALFGAVTTAYSIYQRLFVSNADTLIYLYAVVFTILFHFFLFSTVLAFAVALFSSWKRRRRILKRRRINASSTLQN